MVIELESGPDEIWTLKNISEEFIQTQVDAYGYLRGYGYEVEITTGGLEHETPTLFGVGFGFERDPSQWPCTAMEAIELAGRDPYLRRATAAFRQAIRSPWDTVFLSYRAAEIVMQSFREDGAEKKIAWERMRAALNIDRASLDALRRDAEAPRHGELGNVSTTAQQGALRYVQVVLDRFVSYRKGGNEPLDKSVFEPLPAINTKSTI